MPTLNYPIRIKRERNLIDLPEQNPGGALVVLTVLVQQQRLNAAVLDALHLVVAATSWQLFRDPCSF
jgi:hypothetical protein